MASIATGLARALPKPKYNSEYEELKAQQLGPRIVGAGQLDDTQVVLKVSPQKASTFPRGLTATNTLPSQRTGPPEYPNRAGWRPRGPEDFGDGGAFPEIPVAQYVWGQKNSTSSNALVVQVDGEGKVDYTAIARQGHGNDRIIHASFKDLIPLRQRAEAGDLDLSRPSQEEVQATAERTKNALASLVSGAVAAQKPKNIAMNGRREPTFVRYTPSAQMGDKSKKQDRIIKIVERQKGMFSAARLLPLLANLCLSDPMEPPKFKHKKIPRGPPTPPPPVCLLEPRKPPFLHERIVLTERT
jgi:SNW domain-containing protein 1